MQRTKTQNSRLYYLLNKTGMTDDRAALVSDVTKGRTESTKELTAGECQTLISRLQAYQKEQPISTEHISLKKMRSKVLHIATKELKWVKPDGSIDWQRFNGFMLARGYLKKPLYQYDKAELPRLITQFEQLSK